jgi:hypothetical protein
MEAAAACQQSTAAAALKLYCCSSHTKSTHAHHTTRSTLVVFTPAYDTSTFATPTFSPMQFAVATLFTANLGLTGLHLTIPAGVTVTVAVLLALAGLPGRGGAGGGKLSARMRIVVAWLTCRRVALTEVTKEGAPAPVAAAVQSIQNTPQTGLHVMQRQKCLHLYYTHRPSWCSLCNIARCPVSACAAHTLEHTPCAYEKQSCGK